MTAAKVAEQIGTDQPGLGRPAIDHAADDSNAPVERSMAVTEEGRGQIQGGADFPVYETMPVASAFPAFPQVPAVVGSGLHPVDFFDGT